MLFPPPPIVSFNFPNPHLSVYFNFPNPHLSVYSLKLQDSWNCDYLTNSIIFQPISSQCNLSHTSRRTHRTNLGLLRVVDRTRSREYSIQPYRRQGEESSLQRQVGNLFYAFRRLNKIWEEYLILNLSDFYILSEFHIFHFFRKINW